MYYQDWLHMIFFGKLNVTFPKHNTSIAIAIEDFAIYQRPCSKFFGGLRDFRIVRFHLFFVRPS